MVKRRTYLFPFGRIFDRELAVIVITEFYKTFRHADLQRRRCTHIDQVIEIPDGLAPALVADAVSHPPARDAEGLGHAGYGDGPFPYTRQRHGRDMFCIPVEEVLVDLVGEDEKVISFRKVSYEFEFILSEDLARRVGRRVHHDASCLRRDGILKIFQEKGPVRRLHPYVCGDTSRGHERLNVIPIVRLEQDHLVSRVQQGQAGAVEHPCGPRTGYDLVFRVDVDPVGSLIHMRNGSSKFHQTGIVCVGVDTLVHGLLRTAAHHQRDLGVAYALGEIDPADALALDGHVPDLRLENPLTPFTQTYGHFSFNPFLAVELPHYLDDICHVLVIDLHVHGQGADLPAQGLGLGKALVFKIQGLVPVVGLAELGENLHTVGLEKFRKCVSLSRSYCIVLIDMVPAGVIIMG